MNCKVNPNINPIIKSINNDILLLKDIINICSGDRIQVNIDPDLIPKDVSIIIGIKASIERWFEVIGFDLILNLFEENDIRIEYDAVIPIDKVIKISIIIFKFEDIIFSKIISLEKNPDINGIPINDNLFTPNIDKTIG